MGASAALLGLLFVAISINLEQILKHRHLPGRAAGTLGFEGQLCSRQRQNIQKMAGGDNDERADSAREARRYPARVNSVATTICPRDVVLSRISFNGW